jgi:hypothetical protein
MLGTRIHDMKNIFLKLDIYGNRVLKKVFHFLNRVPYDLTNCSIFQCNVHIYVQGLLLNMCVLIE